MLKQMVEKDSREQEYKLLDKFIDQLETKEGELITVLHKAQEIFGSLPIEVQEFVADRLGVSLAKVYGVVSFYSYFTMVPKGKYPISICLGTACYVKGSERILDEFQRELGIKAGETTNDLKFSLEGLRCVGACGLAPVVMIGEKIYGRVTVPDVKKILDECNK